MQNSTTGMTSDYAHNDTFQERVEVAAERLVVQAAGHVATVIPGAFVIVDYGCSTNPHSATMLRAIGAIRAVDETREIAVVHNDLPSNDWSVLSRAVADPTSGYTSKAPNVYTMISPRSFFEAVVPRWSAHLGISFSAAHWLRTQPSLPAGSWCFSDAREPARTQLADLAAQDWERFLLARSHELAAGAVLIVSMIGTAGAEGGSNVTAHELLRFMRETAEEFVGQGQLNRGVFEEFVFPTYARTAQEAQAPLLPGRGLAPYFDVLAIDIVPIANPYLELLDRGQTAEYVKRYLGFVRAFSAGTLLAHLFTPGAQTAKPADLLDRYYARLAERLAQDPTRGIFSDWTLNVMARRR